jgi:serine/threonine protein kinase
VSEDFPVLAGFRAGSLVAGYRLEAQVGAGGMAVVFRARDERLGRLVALKLLSPALAADPAFRRRFIAESRAAAVVDNPHIIPVFEAGELDGVLFIAMRFVAGGDLRGVLEREGPLPPGRAAGFISPVASALDGAHRAGLVHRDVKPANILVDAATDRPDHVYLSDFGVSKGAVSSVSLAGTGHFLGTPDYSAPEQIQGRTVDGRTDQYALACVAFQLLTGTVPFERDQGMAVLLAHLSEPPPSLNTRRPGLSEAADRVLARAMAKVPEKRYGSCRDFADALRDSFGLQPYTSPGLGAAPGHTPTEPGAPRAGFCAPVPAVASDLPDSAVVETADSAPGSGQTSAAEVSPAAPSTAGHRQDPPAVPPDASPTITTPGSLIAPEPAAVPLRAGTVRPESEAVAPESGSALTGHTPLITSEPETRRPGAGAVTGERETMAADPETGPQQIETATPEPGPGPEPILAPELIPGPEPETELEAAVVPPPRGDLHDKRRPRVRRALVLRVAAAILLIASGATALAVNGSGHHAPTSLTGTRTRITPPTSLVTTAPAQSATTQRASAAARTTRRPPVSSSGGPNAQPTTANTTAQVPTTAPALAPSTSSSKPRPTPTPKPTHTAPPTYYLSVSNSREYSCADEGSLHSIINGELVTFEIDNYVGPASVQIDEISTSGSPEYYETLAVGEGAEISTNVGAYWVVESSGGGCLAVFGVTGWGLVTIT